MGAWLWDTFMSFPEDFLMFRDHAVRISDVVYILARLASFGFITASLIFQVASVPSCHQLAKAIGWLAALAFPLNSLLFFFRVRAVFYKHPLIIAFFALSWLATLGGSLTAPFAVDGVHIGSTQNCVNSNVKSFGSAGIIATAVNDTLVFLAISAQLVMYTLADTWAARVKAFMKGQGLGKVSKTLLQSGQLYYMATVGMNLVAAVVILTPSVPPVLRAMFSIPNVALQNVMACRVYRQLKLGLIREQASPVTVQFTTRSQGVVTTTTKHGGHVEHYGDHYGRQGEISLHNMSTTSRGVLVDIDREVEVTVDDTPSNKSWKVPDLA
ncbi:hypothetical protein EUX98_g2588 [Antrodiella citrinella]|uniref:Uncharacterized protein n=1 Tax=Antrodiella citrinella TaxID=2447956 RepID=A0A4V3XJ39_9APHY|nr:hypothetical protein EUX98_g2588 [Antrodiella citrinella]